MRSNFLSRMIVGAVILMMTFIAVGAFQTKEVEAGTCSGAFVGGTGICYPTVPIKGDVLVGDGVGNWVQTATSSLGISGGSGGTGNVATSTGESTGQLAYWTSTNGTPATLGKVATSTLMPSSPLTGSFVQIGSSGSLGCQIASGSQAGCLSSADWNTFNGKLSTEPFWVYANSAISTTSPVGIYASTTIGNASQTTGLTISGGSTTTQNAYFASSVGIATTSPGVPLDILLGGSYASLPKSNVIEVASSSRGTATSSLFLLDSTGSLKLGGGTDAAFSATNGNLQTNGQISAGNDIFIPNSNEGIFFANVNSFAPGIEKLTTSNAVEFVPNSIGSTGSESNTYFSAGGDWGISTSSPSAELAISANSGQTFPGNNLFQVASSTASATTTLFNVSNTGAITQGGGATSTFSNGVNLSAGCITYNGGTCLTSNTGTVTSVGLSDSNSTLTIGATPVTTSGTITATLNLAHANTWSALQTFNNASTTLLSITTQGWAKIFEGTYYADSFAGADIGAQINAAYAACPSIGCPIYVPTGSYTFSTPIVFGTAGKVPTLICGAGGGAVNLTYTGVGTSTTFNYLNLSGSLLAGGGGQNCNLIGQQNAGTIGLQIGGSNGSNGISLSNIHVINFAQNIVMGANNWEINLTNVKSEYGLNNLVVEPANNSGEQININGASDFSDSLNTHYDACVVLQNSSVSSINFDGTSFDDCNVQVADGNFQVNFDGDHWENPDYNPVGNYTYLELATTSSNGFSNIAITNSTFENDATTTGKSPYQYILNGTKLVMSGDEAVSNNGITVTDLVQNVNTGEQSLEVYGFRNIGESAVTNVATSSLLFSINSSQSAGQLIETGIPFDGITLNASVNGGGTAGYGFFDTGANNYIQSNGNPIQVTNSSQYGQFPLIIQNPNSINASSTGIGFAVSNEVAQPGLSDGVVGAGVIFQRIGGGSYGDLAFLITDSNNLFHEVMRITNTQNVGISTTTPQSKLVINGTTSTEGYLQIASSTNQNIFNVYSTGQLEVGGLPPTVATSTGSGTGSVPVTLTGSSNDFNFNITTGTSPSGTNATIATFTMPSACPNRTVPVFSDANKNTDALAVVSIVFASSTSATQFVLVSGATGLAAATNYIWDFHVGCN